MLCLLIAFMNIVLDLLIPSFSNFEGINLITKLSTFLEKVHTVTVTLSLVLLSLLVLSVMKEVFSRIINDSFLNYCKSIAKTVSIRRFLSQKERTKKSLTVKLKTV